MNIETYPRKVSILSSPITKELIEKLKRLSRKLGGYGYSHKDTNQIIMSTFLDLPYSVDWFDLSTTESYYSLKAKVEFKTEETDLVFAISKYLLALSEEAEELVNRLNQKIDFHCSLLGFDLETESSGSSEDSSSFIQLYKSKLTKNYKK